MRRFFILMVALAAASCSGERSAHVGSPGLPPQGAVEIAMPHAQTFTVYERDGYRIVDFAAPVVSWGGDAKGADQTERVVLVPKDREAPEMAGELEGAVLVRTPVERIAVNYGFLEAVVTTLGVNDRLVAVGGVKSYNDDIRARTRSGELAQIGYGWHVPPQIDTLLGTQPDVFFTVLSDLGHKEHYDRIKALGIPVVPIFFEVETTYMGPVDYVRLLGMFTGREKEAEAFASMVENNVASLKASVADQEKRRVIDAWFAGSGRWAVTVRNAKNQLMVDAGGINPMAEPDDIRLDDFQRMGSEALLEAANDVDCWIIRDSHSQPFTDVSYLQNFKAWREGCLFAADGQHKPEADAFDIYETGILRPDIMLRDLIGMLHPELTDEPFIYIQPDKDTPRL